MISLVLAVLLSLQQPPDLWIGIGFASVENGLRVTSLPYGSPAEKAGVMIDDVIVGLDAAKLLESVSMHAPGDEMTLSIMRDGELREIKVLVGERPVGIGAVKEYSPIDFPQVRWPEEQLATALIDELKIAETHKDLRQRLGRLSDRGDQFRLSRTAYIQDNPFQLRTIAGRTIDNLAVAMNQRDPLAALRLAAEWLDAEVEPPAPLKKGLNLEQHLDQLVALFRSVSEKQEEAFAKLTPEERKYIEDNGDEVFTAFSQGFDLQGIRDNGRRQRITRVLELASRLDFVKMFEGAALYWGVAQDGYLDDLESAATKGWEAAGKPEGIFINRESPIGKIVVGGSGSGIYTEDAAILVDLAGKDFYANNSGSPRLGRIPVGLLIDFAGDDAYEATVFWTQGAARMGHGLLVDRKGNDEYVGFDWTQGAAVLGVALFLDESGDDVYRAIQYAQGVAAWGIAIHMDYEGDDIYESHLLSQAVGMPGGAGWLANGRGNDRYYAKGKNPTGYGDPGIFDSWSQGCGVGFRSLQSGGVALLYDGDGRDRYNAGNFSQGGGYYFGIGLLRDDGRENDAYVGSRYNQGFAAHQAIGYFEEAGGNDLYTTRQWVAQGLSWDETISVFIDHEGDDVYEGGAGFSQGASAHNGFCLFLELGGRNRFVYASPQASAGPNDFHGGVSFSLLVAADSKANTYNSTMKPGTIRMNGEHGIFVDLPTSIEAALRTKLWQRLIIKN